MNLNNRFQKIAVVIIFIGLAFYIGHQIGVADNGPGDISDITNSQNYDINEADFSLFWEVVNSIKQKHLKGGELSDEEILYGAIQGAVNSLDDPYSSFFPPEDAQRFNEDITGVFGGIGAEIGIRDNQLTIISPLKGSPAERAGLKSGDKILRVDEESTEGISVDRSVKIIRGEEGTEVNLLISREEWSDPREITVTREIIEVPTLDWEMKDDNITYVQLYSFNANAPQLFYEASLSALFRGSKGLVLDLRNNSGGYLDVAVNLAGWFLDRGEIVVQEKFPSGNTRDFRSNGNGAWGNVPIVILVNGGSASASEILAGAVRDSAGAVLVGEKTFGKGTVQQVETFRDGSKVKITVAEWVLPSGETINDSGIEPDVRVEITEEDINNDNDPQLEKALEILRGKIKNSEK